MKTMSKSETSNVTSVINFIAFGDTTHLPSPSSSSPSFFFFFFAHGPHPISRRFTAGSRADRKCEHRHAREALSDEAHTNNSWRADSIRAIAPNPLRPPPDPHPIKANLKPHPRKS